MAVFVELTPGDAVAIGKSVVRMEKKSGQRVRLAITSSEGVALVKDDDVSQRLKDTRRTPPHPAPEAGARPFLQPPAASGPV